MKMSNPTPPSGQARACAELQVLRETIKAIEAVNVNEFGGKADLAIARLIESIPQAILEHYPSASPGVRTESEAELIAEKQIVAARMQHDVNKFGELTCDYDQWLREINEKLLRLSAPAAPVRNETGHGYNVFLGGNGPLKDLPIAWFAYEEDAKNYAANLSHDDYVCTVKPAPSTPLPESVRAVCEQLEASLPHIVGSAGPSHDNLRTLLIHLQAKK